MKSLIPTPDEVLKELAPIISVIYDALEFGTYQAREYFARNKQPFSSYLASDIARYQIIQTLKLHSIQAEIEDLTIQSLALNGVLIKFKNFNIRILKAQDGQLPTPGPSKARQDFYNQVLPFTEEDVKEIIAPYFNLVILWRTDQGYNLLGKLKLLLPQGGGTTRDSVHYSWQTTLPDPIEMMTFSSETSEIELEDLDISLDQRQDKDKKEQDGSN